MRTGNRVSARSRAENHTEEATAQKRCGQSCLENEKARPNGAQKEKSLVVKATQPPSRGVSVLLRRVKSKPLVYAYIFLFPQTIMKRSKVQRPSLPAPIPGYQT